MATIDNYAINIKVQGADQVTAASTATDNLGKSINNLPLKGLEDNSGKAAASVKNLHEGMATLGEKAELLGTAIAGIGMVEFVRSLAEGASKVKDLSEAFGVSIESVLELEAGMNRAGRSTESMSKLLYTLADSALSAANDINGKTMMSFQKLGITFDDLKSKSPKELMKEIAESMIKAGGSAESLTAAQDILGRSAKGLPWGDFLEGLEKVDGKMGDVAKGTKEFDEAMKAMEANIAAVRREMTVILTPVVEFFNAISHGSGAAKVEAYALTAAMLALSASLAVKGFTMIADGAKAIAGALGLSTVATNAESVSLAANSAAQGVNAAARAEGIAARVASLQSTVASARAHIAEIEALIANNAAMQTNVIVTTELFAARRALWVATGQLTAQEGLLAEATVLSGAATATVATETSAAAVSTGMFAGALARVGMIFEGVVTAVAGFGATVLAVVGIVGAPVWATVAAAIAAIGAALAVVTVLWRAFGDEATAVLKSVWNGIKDFAGGIVDSIDGAVTKMSNGLRSLVGLAPKLTGENQSNAETNRLATQDKPQLGADIKAKDQQAAGNFALAAQYQMQVQMTEQSRQRLQLELDLVGAGEARKAQAMAEFEFYSKRDTEVLRLQNEITRVQKEQKASEEPQKFSDQLSILEKQLVAVKGQKDTTSAMVGDIKRAEQSEQARLQYVELQKKIKDNIYNIDQQIADLSRSEDDRRLAALDKEVRAEQIAAVAKRQAQLGDTKMAPGEQAAIEQRVADAYANQRVELVKLNAALKANEEILFLRDLQYKKSEDMLKLNNQMNQLTMTGDQQRIAALKEQIQLEGLAEIKKREAALGPGGTLDELEKVKIMNQVAAAYDPIIAKQEELNAKARDFSTGWQKAFNSYMDDATNASKMAEQAFSSMTGRMNSAIDNFVDTGKFSFEDFTRSIIQDLIKIELKAQATKLLGALTGGGSGALGGGFIGSLLGMFGFADGGDPPVGKPSIVGERGPEVFIPKQAGTIMPMTGAGGAPQQNITNETHNYNISAIDSKSVAQLFAENRKALLGTVQLAQKELPYGNR